MSASRSSISFQENIWKKLNKEKNKSRVVNLALDFYYHAQEVRKKREEEFILNELKHYEDSNESYTFEETFDE